MVPVESLTTILQSTWNTQLIAGALTSTTLSDAACAAHIEVSSTSELAGPIRCIRMVFPPGRMPTRGQDCPFARCDARLPARVAPWSSRAAGLAAVAGLGRQKLLEREEL